MQGGPGSDTGLRACAVAILGLTRALEVAGVLPFFHMEQWIIEWEKTQ